MEDGFVIEVDRADQPLTYYFRTQIEVTGLDDFPLLRLSYVRDDGMILYINGEEVRRDNVPAGEVTAETLASVSIDGMLERSSNEVFVPVNVLREGVNTIAVEIHQSSPFSSDMRFGLALTLTDLTLPEQTIPIGTGFENAPADLPFAVQFPAGEFPFVNQGLLRGEPLESTQLGISGFRMTGESVALNIMGFSDIQVAIDIRTENSQRDFAGSDYLRTELLVSLDGESFDRYHWLDLKSGAEPAVEWSDLVTDQTFKKAIVPTGALEPQPEWQLVDFDDSNWLVGSNGVGYDSPGGSFEEFVGIDVREQMKGLNGVVYLRAPFTIGSLTEVDAFRLRMRYDDGFVAFLNGVELARENAPENVQWNSIASQSHADSRAVVYSDYDIHEHLSLLNEGDNVLSLVGLNATVVGSDMLLSPVLQTGVVSEDQSKSLSSMERGPNGSFTTLISDRSLVPSEAVAVKLRLEARAGRESAIYFDNIRITGVPKIVDSYQSFLTSTTDWLLEDPRRDPDQDPDGDGMSNLLEYAFQTNPSSARSGISRLPELKLNRDGTVTVTYYQIDNTVEGSLNVGFRAQDLVYLPQISLSDLDVVGDFVWLEEQSAVFENGYTIENVEGANVVRVSLKTREPLVAPSRQVFARLLVQLAD